MITIDRKPKQVKHLCPNIYTTPQLSLTDIEKKACQGNIKGYKKKSTYISTVAAIQTGKTSWAMWTLQSLQNSKGLYSKVLLQNTCLKVLLRNTCLKVLVQTHVWKFWYGIHVWKFCYKHMSESSATKYMSESSATNTCLKDLLWNTCLKVLLQTHVWKFCYEIHVCWWFSGYQFYMGKTWQRISFHLWEEKYVWCWLLAIYKTWQKISLYS